MDAETQSNAMNIVIGFLSESLLGRIILTIVILGIISAPVFRFFIKEYKEFKAKQEAKEAKQEEEKEAEIERRIQERERTEQFRSGVESNLRKIDNLTKEVGSIEEDLVKIKQMRSQLTDELHKSMHELEARMDTDREHSDSQDNSITSTLKEINTQVENVRTDVVNIGDSAKLVEEKLEIIFEGENDEFRMYIIQLHDKYAKGDGPIELPKNVKQELRLKYGSYKKRNGNGWAESMYKELMGISSNDDK